MSDSEKNLIHIVNKLKHNTDCLKREVHKATTLEGTKRNRTKDVSKNVKELLDCVQEVQDAAGDAIIHIMTASDMVADDGSLLGAQVMRRHAKKLADIVDLEITAKK